MSIATLLKLRACPRCCEPTTTKSGLCPLCELELIEIRQLLEKTHWWINRRRA